MFLKRILRDTLCPIAIPSCLQHFATATCVCLQTLQGHTADPQTSDCRVFRITSRLSMAALLARKQQNAVTSLHQHNHVIKIGFFIQNFSSDPLFDYKIVKDN
ncbi:hypothetical protein ANTQUA_LOCUS4177 [Anthophora quadrimaculata]